MSEAVPVIRGQGLERRYAERRVLRGVDVQLFAGETLAVFGENGAGKSTLLGLLALRLRIHGGQLDLFGRPAGRRDAPLRGRIGAIGHATHLVDALTAHENVALRARLYGLGDARTRADRALDELGLASRAGDPVDEFSRGMQQRVALAASLIHGPDLLLLDEPFSGLDATAARWLAARLADHASSGGSSICVTHDIERGLALANRWLVLRAGRVVADGDARTQTALDSVRRAIDPEGPA